MLVVALVLSVGMQGVHGRGCAYLYEVFELVRVHGRDSQSSGVQDMKVVGLYSGGVGEWLLRFGFLKGEGP